MSDYTSAIYQEVSNGTTYSSSVTNGVLTLISNLSLARSAMANVGFNSNTLTRVDNVSSNLSSINDHVQDQLTNLTKNTTIFSEYTASITSDSGSYGYDVNSFFGTIMSGVDNLSNTATPIITYLANANTSADISSLGILENSVVLVYSNSMSEANTINSAIQMMLDQAESININNLVNSPVGSYILRQIGGDGIQSVLDMQDNAISLLMDQAPAPDPSLPVSSDTSTFNQGASADPTP